MRRRLVVVVPVFNEAGVLEAFHARLAAVLDRLDLDSGVLYVDDGSRDASWAIITRMALSDPRIRGLRLSRNFGKELALTAGLDAAMGADAVVVIDADLQDPPELIPELVAHWERGFEVVCARRLERAGESWLKRATAAGFYRVMRRLSPTPIPEDTGDFRLLARPALEALRQLRERQRFMKGLFAWVGFRQCAVGYRRDPRYAGRSKFDYWRLWNLALEGITSFSTVPLRVATYLGLAAALLAFAGGTWVVLKTLIWGDPVAGYPSLMVVILALGGLQLMALGILGEYLGRLYMEAKGRPLYLVAETLGPAADAQASPAGLSSQGQIKEAAMRTVKQLLEAKGGAIHAIRPDVPVLDAVRMMAEREVGALLVMEGDKLVGIISERDYARKVILRGRSSSETLVSEVMTPEVKTVAPDRSVHGCMKLMTENRIRHLPVVEGGKVVGVVSIGDLVKAVIEDQQEEIAQLQAYITG
ncbi:MAG: hypothetical protein KatS3mg126_0504 [Lysobacteraceae bacterium]|nr:MAG: hypothetical protein KatS3mg126_0504 [Xanthomonadaceae bacterium]